MSEATENTAVCLAAAAEDFNEDMAGDYKITRQLRLGGKTLLIGQNPEDEKAPYLSRFSGWSPL